MRVAIIDLGTNSVRFDVHQFGPGRLRMKTLHREKIMVRLGQGVFAHGVLDPKAVTRTLHAFLRFKRVAAQLRVDKMLAFGTSALREVVDREKFLEDLRKESGIDVRMISGIEEAKLIALGILTGEKLPKGRFALVDIGGGSTEISICRAKKILHSFSFPLGTARLQQLFLMKSPPSKVSVDDLRLHIRNTLLQVMQAERWPKVENIIGSSGTIRALAKLQASGKGETELLRGPLKSLIGEMSGMTTTELLGISGMESKRVDMILAGALLFDECLQALGAKKARTTEFSLRDGLLVEERQLHREGKHSHISLHVDALYAKAVQFGASEEHLQRVVKLSSELFKKLQDVHKLKPQWQIYLTAAVILRDTGEVVSLSQHAVHSGYIVRNTDLPPMEEWETEMIAALCRRHEGFKLDRKDIPFGRNRARREAFVKVLALLRLVDALDSGPETQVLGLRVKRMPRKVELVFSGRRLTGLESLSVELVSPFFEKVFRKAVSARPAGTRRS